jgi:ATP-dependent DNA helicase UvrD/PcrA
MERIEVIERAAGALRARYLVGAGDAGGESTARWLERLCALLKFELVLRSERDVMLGGAYSRLQLWAWDRPDFGGMIWLRDDLDPETRVFAIAHELGHYALHRGEGINIHAACDPREIDQQADAGNLRVEERQVQEYTPRARRELEASAFAAELLAPRAEVRRLFTASPDVSASRLATLFGISQTLAQRRLIDAVLAAGRPLAGTESLTDQLATEEAAPPDPEALLARLDDRQREAARAQGPALVVAGPGTGKTATLVGRVAHLVLERHVPPEHVLALTFSNRAAGEMRERLEGSALPGERMPIMTIHAFAATLLREYFPHVPHAADEAELKPDFRILDGANAYLLMEELLGDLPLRYYRSLGNPTAHLRALLDDFSHARDSLLTPVDYAALVETMREMPEISDDAEPAMARKKLRPPEGMFTREQIERARERANAYAIWDRALRRRGLVDFGSLVQRAVELLRANLAVLADVRTRYPQVLVDEFQDTNRAAGELLALVAGPVGGGLWVVGDRNQSIYRFRGASPGNQAQLTARYPALRVLRLRRCYRSAPAIVRLGSAMAARMAELAPGAATQSEAAGALHEALLPLALDPVRPEGTLPAVLRMDDFASAAQERASLAAVIARYHAAGYAFGDQAILCRTHKQVRQIAASLAAAGVPVSQLADFFERPEVKDALMLFFVAAGRDASGILRADPLLLAMGYPPPLGAELGAELAATVRYLTQERQRLPWALRTGLRQIAALSPTTRAGLVSLGEQTTALYRSDAIGHALAAFLLRPGGYAWRLARVADALDAPQASLLLVVREGASRAQQALAALGELVRLVWQFESRWSQEPEFRAQLSRAVALRRPTRPPLPDATMPSPNADVADVSAMVAADPAESAPAVSCFLHYLRALRAADVSVPVPAGEDDAVHVLTLHQSKGLEFPVVLLPGLALGQFPVSKSNRDEACPQGFRESDAPGEGDAEERCLFYVGVTRARDVVGFSRATSYPSASGGKPRPAQPSPLLALLDGSPEWRDAGPLLSGAEHDQALSVAATADEMDGDEGNEDDQDDDAEMGDAVGYISPADTSAKPTFDLHALEEYLDCPRKYKYEHPYGLFDPVGNAVYRFHRYIRSGMRQLREEQQRPGATWDAAQPQLRALWEQEGPAGHAYDAFYWQAAEAILREEWQSLTAPGMAERARRVELAQPLSAELRTCFVRVTADRVTGEIAGATERPLIVLVRMHTGRPNAEHRKDLALPLFYLAHQQQHPETPVEIALAYKGRVLAEDATDEREPGSLEDVTDEARKVAEKYRDPTRRARSRLDKLDRAASGILAGSFPPRPDEQRCAACPYCYVCPADPDPANIPAGWSPSAADTAVSTPSAN